MKLVICYTPLHALIVERLIKLKVIDDYYLLYICFSDNIKHRHYYDRIKKEGQSEFLILKHSIINDAFKINLFKKHLPSNIEFSTLIVGNLKHVYSRFIAWLLSINDFMTFDDGSGNISGSGYLYDMKEHPISSVFFNAISPSFLYKECVKQIGVHYSLYDQINVYSEYCSNVNKLALFEASPLCARPKMQPAINVYLGNSFSEDNLTSSEYENEFDISVVNRYHIDLYLPHPRRVNLTHVEGKTQIKHEETLISEEVILNLLASYEEVYVYGCYSSVLFNLVSISGVNLVNLHIEVDKPVSVLETQLEKLGVHTLRDVSNLVTGISE